MKRTKRLTRKQKQVANKLAKELAAQKPRRVRKPNEIKPMFSLTRYLHVNAERKHAKLHHREHKREEKAEKAKAGK